MKVDSLLSSARYLALVLPVFALFSTVHSGCIDSASGYYGNYGYGGRRPTAAGSGYASDPPSDCTTYTRPSYGGYGGYGGYTTYTTCDDDDGYYGR